MDGSRSKLLNQLHFVLKQRRERLPSHEYRAFEEGGYTVFSQAIREKIHPATWAVLGLKNDLMGMQVGHRGTGFAVDDHGHILTCWHVTFMDQDCQLEADAFEVVQPEIDITKRHKAK